MPASLLSQLDIAPAQLFHLSGNLRSRVLNFLLRWEAWQETLDCLNELDTPNLVTLQDMQAEAFVGIGHLTDAIAVMQRRVAQKDSATARAQVVRIYLAAGDTAQAQERVRRFRPFHLVGPDRADPRRVLPAQARKGEEGSSHRSTFQDIAFLAAAFRGHG